MIKRIEFNMDENQRELLAAQSGNFSCICRFDDFSTRIDNTIPWHWHPEFEINYAAEGECRVLTVEGEYVVRKGELLFVNSNAIHMLENISDGDIEWITLQFDPNFLGGLRGSVFEEKYIRPIADCADLQAYYIRPQSAPDIGMLSAVHKIFGLYRDESFGYEVEVHARLWEFWLLLLKETEGLRREGGYVGVPQNSGIRLMLSFIWEHYPEKIQVVDIAGAGLVSVRECTRCFRRYIKMPPNEYLNYYRVRMAARELMGGEKTIIEISEDCGFSSVGYLGKVFKKEFGCSPQDYRKRHANT